jgi:hypothetical protein
MMPESKLTDTEKNILKVIKNEIDFADDVPSLDKTKEVLDKRILESEELLRAIGYSDNLNNLEVKSNQEPPHTVVVRPFDELLKDANARIPDKVSFSDIFAPEEITANSDYIKQLNEDFNAIHRLDVADIAIPAVAGILSGVVDCAFGGFIRVVNGKSIPGPFSEYVSKLFDKVLPKEKIKELET